MNQGGNMLVHQKMIRLEEFEQEKLVIIKYSGRIDEEFLISFMEFLYSNVNRDTLEKALIDFRDAEMDFNIDALKYIVSLRIQKYSEGFTHKLNSVYLIQEAKATAFTTLYAKAMPQSHIKVNICSTMEYALRLLFLNITATEVEQRILKLSTVFPSDAEK